MWLFVSTSTISGVDMHFCLHVIWQGRSSREYWKLAFELNGRWGLGCHTKRACRSRLHVQLWSAFSFTLPQTKRSDTTQCAITQCRVPPTTLNSFCYCFDEIGGFDVQDRAKRSQLQYTYTGSFPPSITLHSPCRTPTDTPLSNSTWQTTSRAHRYLCSAGTSKKN